MSKPKKYVVQLTDDDVRCLKKTSPNLACLQLGALTDKMLSGNFFNRTIRDSY